jgi:hypothetical protein
MGTSVGIILPGVHSHHEGGSKTMRKNRWVCQKEIAMISKIASLVYCGDNEEEDDEDEEEEQKEKHGEKEEGEEEEEPVRTAPAVAEF